MKKMIMLAAAMLASSPAFAADDWGSSSATSWDAKPKQEAAAPANVDGKQCGQDDARLANIVPVLKDLRAGKTVEPLKITFGTYMDLTTKVRGILGDNIVIVTPSCKDAVLFEGELTSKVQLPFPEALVLINQSLQQRDSEKLKFIFKNVQAESASRQEIMSFTRAQTYPLETGKVLATVANIKPLANNDDEIGIAIISLYAALGGTLNKGEDNVIYITVYNWGVSGVSVDNKDWLGVVHRSDTLNIHPILLTNIYNTIGIRPIR
ncbi:MAG: hypothetical protein Q9N67_01765 [Ghiorsea sp.]|nr:hypothetical protein [Ghiorsea sp.]